MSSDTIAPAQAPRHLSYLDAARGIAALMVLFGHYVCRKYASTPTVKGLNFLFNAADAVSFFFVLSGMVLSYQYIVLGKSLDMRRYYINRFLRLFPAFFLTVLINALWWQRHNFTMPEIYHDIIQGNNGFWEEALLFKSHSKFFGPGWTLGIELSASFFIPFLIVIGKYNRKLLWWFILAYFIVGRFTNYFAFHFVLGVIISCYFFEYSGEAMKAKKWYKFRYLIMLAAVVLFSIRRIEDLSPFGPTAYYLADFLELNLFQLTGIASFIFIIWMMRNPRAQRVLEHSILQYIGKISYSIYLMHWLVVDIIYVHWDEVLAFFPNIPTAFIVMMFVCFFVTLLLATIVYYAVELPFIRLGKRITNRMKPSLVIN